MDFKIVSRKQVIHVGIPMGTDYMADFLFSFDFIMVLVSNNLPLARTFRNILHRSNLPYGTQSKKDYRGQ